MRKRRISDLKIKNPELRATFEAAVRHAEGTSALLRNSGRFPLAGRGDVNTYAVFVELMVSCLNPVGRIGVIVPTGIATDDTTKHLFGHLVDSNQLISLYDFENRKGIFPAVTRLTKFCLLTLTGTQRNSYQATFAFFTLDPADLDNTERCFFLTTADFTLMNPNTRTCPIFRTARDAEITKNVYRRLQVLLDETIVDDPWSVSFQGMLHMSNDSHLFRDREWLQSQGYILQGNYFVDRLHGSSESAETRSSSRYLPLYEAKMIHHFDHRWATYDRGRFRNVTVDEKQDPTSLPLPRFWVAESEVTSRVDASSGWLLGWRNVARSTDFRTWLMSPYGVTAAGNSLQQVSCSEDVPRAALHAVTSSFVSDFIARQKIGGPNLNHFIIKQLPILSPRVVSQPFIRDRVCELSFTSWDMVPFAQDLGYDGPPFRWDEERRALIRAELDALMFHLYGLDGEDTNYIIDTFPSVRRKDEDIHREFRTKRLILERYDAMTEAFKTTHGTLVATPNGPNPPLDRSDLEGYSDRLDKALSANYQTNVDPLPAHPSQAHPASTRPSWASPIISSLPQRENPDYAVS